MNTTRPRDGWVLVGMAVAAASAATASFTGLRGLALVAGWPERLAWLLPVTIDAYAMTSARVWLANAGHTRRGRRFAQANAVGAIVASIVGNAAYHAISVELLTVSWPIVVVVGAVPAAVLGLTAHLHALRTLNDAEPDRTAKTESGPTPDPDRRTEDDRRDDGEDRTQSGTTVRPRTRPRRRTKARTEDGLLTAARAADTKYRAAHAGRPITRDALRAVLRIAGPRATELRRQLAAEAAEAAATAAQPGRPAAPEPNDTSNAPDREEALTTA